MDDTKILSLPIMITFDLATDKPEASGLMGYLRKLGFVQDKVEGTMTRVKYKGTFNGNSQTLSELVQAVKGHRIGLQPYKCEEF